MKRTGIFVYSALLFGLIGWLNLITGDDRQYRRLAESFLDGNLFLLSRPANNWADTALFGGHYYSAFGPFPAVLIMPLVKAGYFHQGLLSFVGSLVVFHLCFQLARKFDYSHEDSCWFAVAFCFATSFIGVAALACSTFFAHVLAVVFLFLAINEYEGRRRQGIVGGLVGLAMATRPPAGLNILYFVLAVFLGSGTIRQRTAELWKLLLPYAVIMGLLTLYNFARFGNPLELGYSYQLNGYGMPYAEWSVPGNAAGPTLSLSHIPSHLWIFLFGLPSAQAIGNSVLLMSPFLVYLSSARWDLTDKLIALNIIPVLLTVLAFRSTGFEQVGYRFSLDFLPFVFWSLIRSQVEVTDRFKAWILLSTVIDVGLTMFFLASGVDRRLGEAAAAAHAPLIS